MEYIYKKLIKPIWVWGWEHFGFGDVSQDQPNEDVSRHFMNGWKDSNLKFQFNDESERSKVRRATQVIKITPEITQNFTRCFWVGPFKGHFRVKSDWLKFWVWSFYFIFNQNWKKGTTKICQQCHLVSL